MALCISKEPRQGNSEVFLPLGNSHINYMLKMYLIFEVSCSTETASLAETIKISLTWAFTPH